MTTFEYCQRQKQEIEQLRGLVFSAAYRLRTFRRLSRADEISPAAAAEIDAIQALLAAHEMGRPSPERSASLTRTAVWSSR